MRFYGDEELIIGIFKLASAVTDPFKTSAGIASVPIASGFRNLDTVGLRNRD